MLAPAQYDTLDHFIAWLETKDPNEEFDVTYPSNCALGQYDKANGRNPRPELDGRFDGRGAEIIVGSDRGQYFDHIFKFGDVLKRAKKARGW